MFSLKNSLLKISLHKKTYFFRFEGLGKYVIKNAKKGQLAFGKTNSQRLVRSHKYIPDIIGFYQNRCLDARFEKRSPAWQCRRISKIPVIFRKMCILLVTLASNSL